jgi:hypothetical protein
MITHQAYCGTLLAGERKSDRPYICAIVQHNFDAALYKEMVIRQFHTAGLETTIKSFRATVATPAGKCKPGRNWPVTPRDIADAVDWLGGLGDEAILRRELAKRLADADEYIAKTAGKPQVLSWHMTAHHGQKALAAARGKSWLRCWALSLVPTATKVSKARKAKDDTEPRAVG